MPSLAWARLIASRAKMSKGMMTRDLADGPKGGGAPGLSGLGVVRAWFLWSSWF